MLTTLLKKEKEVSAELEEKLKQALSILRKTDFSVLKPGKVEIDGNEMFAVVQEYHTSNEDELHYESHEKYADVQYIVAGKEKILVCMKEAVGEVVIPYKEDEDIVFYQDPKTEAKELLLSAGEYVVFMPDDCHKTRCNIVKNGNEPVKKVIIKIKL